MNRRHTDSIWGSRLHRCRPSCSRRTSCTTRHASEPLAKIDPYRILHFLYEANELYKMQKLFNRPCFVTESKNTFYFKSLYQNIQVHKKPKKYQLRNEGAGHDGQLFIQTLQGSKVRKTLGFSGRRGCEIVFFWLQNGSQSFTNAATTTAMAMLRSYHDRKRLVWPPK